AGMASRHKDAHEVIEFGSNETVGYSSHGWRLADAQRKKAVWCRATGVITGVITGVNPKILGQHR
ncbi:MAG: hypothetical protein J6N18_10950, partial [Kiritimatiellae bacterium]|nr:hypothetical protein [Kiritimatiellia bacterium]